MIEDRSEYIGLYVTKEMAKQLEEAKDSKTLKDKILKDFVTNETTWLKEEVQNMDEITLIYRAKLLTIKDNFTKAQDIYVEEIEKLVNVSYAALNPLSSKISELKSEIELVKFQADKTYKVLEKLKTGMALIDPTRLERLLEAIEKFNKLPKDEKELITAIIQKQ